MWRCEDDLDPAPIVDRDITDWVSHMIFPDRSGAERNSNCIRESTDDRLGFVLRCRLALFHRCRGHDQNEVNTVGQVLAKVRGAN